jgi:hypothetical protein
MRVAAIVVSMLVVTTPSEASKSCMSPVVLTAHPSLPVYSDKQTFSVSVGMSQRYQQATFHFGRLAPQRRGVNFLQSLVSGVPPQH